MISCMGSIGSCNDDERDGMRKAVSKDYDAVVLMMHLVQEYVLDLSISLRTGKETNMDFFSRGD